MEGDGALLVRLSAHDGGCQSLVHFWLRKRLLHLQHPTKVQGHPTRRRIYWTILRSSYWPCMASEIYRLAHECHSCVRELIAQMSEVSRLKLLPAKAPLESVAIVILGPLHTTSRGNRYVLVISDRCSKLIRSVAPATQDSFASAKAFCTH